MTKLNKAVYREVELEDEPLGGAMGLVSYAVGLDPDGPSLTLRKKRHHAEIKVPLVDILVAHLKEEGCPNADLDLNEDEEAELLERKGNLLSGEREIVPADLEMWAKTADKKFAVAWEEYKRVRSKYNVAQIVWCLNGSIEVREIPVAD
tara:strand:- start:13544 stop:13990 length:447 start_codon:yes stop_codon:yes gene_type:complete